MPDTGRIEEYKSRMAELDEKIASIDHVINRKPAVYHQLVLERFQLGAKLLQAKAAEEDGSQTQSSG